MHGLTADPSAEPGQDLPGDAKQACGAEACDGVRQRVERSLETLESACRELDRETMTAFRLTVIVPVFNERRTLPQVLDRIDQVMPSGTETIVVDDASTDGTAQWLDQLPSRPDRVIIRRGRNHGKGSAVRLGIRHSRGEIVAIQDADMEYDPEDLLDVITPIQRNQANVVYGSRYLAESDDTSRLHRFGNWLLTATSNCMTGQRLTDMETCHKAFAGDLIRSIPLRECRFGFEPEITGKLASRQEAIIEVPTGYRSRDYSEGKKITWQDGLAAFVCMWRYRTGGWPRRAAAGAVRVVFRSCRWGRDRIRGRSVDAEQGTDEPTSQ
ncbi:glycosyltransferase family 2 protein [Roseiconus nitratireducens]|nr:glycosyltransferase family 2 protein [Roseiconus nitratireducens]